MKGLHYKDVSLISREISTITSRDDIKIEVELFPGVSLTCPIISSPMKDVTNSKIARKMRELGGFGILHRFCSIDEQLEEYKLAGECACAVGLDDFDRVKALHQTGCRYFCLDTANGANVRNKTFIQLCNSLFNEQIWWIVGNIVSTEGFAWCKNIPGVCGIRAGQSGGGACTTKMATGIYSYPVTLLKEINDSQYKNSLTNSSVKIISDGGIEYPLDFCKALIFGSDFIMLGSLIGSIVESPAPIVFQDNKTYKLFRGSASFDIQKIYKEKPRYIEGKSKLIEYKEETLEELLDRFMSGLRSSMSYFNARTLEKYRNNLNYYTGG